MNCNRCGAETAVLETRRSVVVGAVDAIRRRRRCTRPGCDWKGTTYEVLAESRGEARRGIAVITGDVAAAITVLVDASNRSKKEEPKP